MQHAHILYSGTVQGVGFRYAVLRYANRLGVGGWVKNLPCGEVEIFVEGKKKDIEDLCQNIEDHFQGYIRGKEISYQGSSNQFDSFKIVF